MFFGILKPLSIEKRYLKSVLKQQTAKPFSIEKRYLKSVLKQAKRRAP
jgi:hypothetical protein